LPNRSVQSCHNLCKRRFNISNYKGKWTLREEQELLQFVEKEGMMWRKFGELLGRTQTNVRDKWRSLGAGMNSFRKKGPWSLEEIYTLIKLVQQSSEVKLIRKEVEFRINAEEGKPELDEEEIPPFEKLDSNKIVIYKDIRVEEFISLIARRKKLKIVPFHGIDWTPIAEVLKTRSYDDCRNEWHGQLYPIFVNSIKFSRVHDKKLVKRILSQGAEIDEEIDFTQIFNKKTPEENKERWIQLKKSIYTPNKKLSVQDIAEKLLEYYQATSKAASKSDEKELIEEDIVTFYRKYYE